MSDQPSPPETSLETAIPGWSPRKPPPHTPMTGQSVTVEPFVFARHGAGLFASWSQDRDGAMWRYLANGPFADIGELEAHAQSRMSGQDPLFFSIVDRADGVASGVAAYMRIVPEHGAIEVGNLAFSPRLQRSRQASEAMYLMARRAFDELGYRRYEWKCNNANLASRRAALRFGFTFEGVFRKHMVVKGRSRDTAWFAMTDDDWPRIRAGWEAWLDEKNFDQDGRQIKRLEACRSEA